FSPMYDAASTASSTLSLHDALPICTQVWEPAPADVDEDDLPDRGGGQQGSAPSVTRLRADNASAGVDESPAATRIMLRPHDPGRSEEHTSELQSPDHLVCRLLLEKK